MKCCVNNDFCRSAAKTVFYNDLGFIWQTESWPKGEYILSKKDRNAAGLHGVLAL